MSQRWVTPGVSSVPQRAGVPQSARACAIVYPGQAYVFHLRMYRVCSVWCIFSCAVLPAEFAQLAAASR